MAKILIAEDSEMFRSILERTLLKRITCEASFAKTGKEAYEAIKKECPSLLMADIEMPEMNGLELVEKLRAEDAYKNLPVIFLTNRKDKDSVAKALTLNVADYILKPTTNADMLYDKVQRVLRANKISC